MSKPASSEDIEAMQKAQQAAAAAQAMMDQNEKFGPAGGQAAKASASNENEDETTIGMLRRKYGIGGGNPLSGFLGGA
jgi:hypothetical protein